MAVTFSYGQCDRRNIDTCALGDTHRAISEGIPFEVLVGDLAREVL
jgi:hypothetical protein